MSKEHDTGQPDTGQEDPKETRHQQEIHELNCKLREMEDTVTWHRDIRKDEEKQRSSQNEKYQEEIAFVKMQLANALQDHHEGKLKVRDLRDRVSCLEDEVKHWSKKYDQQGEVLLKQREDNENKVGWLNEDMHQAEMCKAQLKKKISKIENEMTCLKLQIKEKTSQFDSDQSLIDTLQRQIQAKDEELNYVHKQYSSLRDTVELLREKIRQLNHPGDRLVENMEKNSILSEITSALKTQRSSESIDGDTVPPEEPDKKTSWLWKMGGAVLGASVIGLAGYGMYKYIMK